jgi:hypothetical protein
MGMIMIVKFITGSIAVNGILAAGEDELEFTLLSQISLINLTHSFSESDQAILNLNRIV